MSNSATQTHEGASVTILETTQQVMSLDSGTLVKSSDERHAPDYWRITSEGVGECLNAGDYVGPVSEVSLPATVISRHDLPAELLEAAK